MSATTSKSEQLQIRVTREQKERIKSAAAEAGQDVSTWVLARIVPASGEALRDLYGRLAVGSEPESLVLAALHEVLASWSTPELTRAMTCAPPATLCVRTANVVAAMVEQACALRCVDPPGWVAQVPALAEPYFASSLVSLRLYLLTHAPPAFRRRNLFVDATIGDRV